MATFTPDLLIDQSTGEIDLVYLAQGAETRARAHYGERCTDSDLAFYAEKLTGIAQILRARRRVELGLPDDTVYVPCAPFGRARQGVRMSEF